MTAYPVVENGTKKYIYKLSSTKLIEYDVGLQTLRVGNVDKTTNITTYSAASSTGLTLEWVNLPRSEFTVPNILALSDTLAIFTFMNNSRYQCAAALSIDGSNNITIGTTYILYSSSSSGNLYNKSVVKVTASSFYFGNSGANSCGFYKVSGTTITKAQTYTLVFNPSFTGQVFFDPNLNHLIMVSYETSGTYNLIVRVREYNTGTQLLATTDLYTKKITSTGSSTNFWRVTGANIVLSDGSYATIGMWFTSGFLYYHLLIWDRYTNGTPERIDVPSTGSISLYFGGILANVVEKSGVIYCYYNNYIATPDGKYIKTCYFTRSGFVLSTVSALSTVARWYTRSSYYWAKIELLDFDSNYYWISYMWTSDINLIYPSESGYKSIYQITDMVDNPLTQYWSSIKTNSNTLSSRSISGVEQAEAISEDGTKKYIYKLSNTKIIEFDTVAATLRVGVINLSTDVITWAATVSVSGFYYTSDILTETNFKPLIVSLTDSKAIFIFKNASNFVKARALTINISTNVITVWSEENISADIGVNNNTVRISDNFLYIGYSNSTASGLYSLPTWSTSKIQDYVATFYPENINSVYWDNTRQHLIHLIYGSGTEGLTCKVKQFNTTTARFLATDTNLYTKTIRTGVSGDSLSPRAFLVLSDGNYIIRYRNYKTGNIGTNWLQVFNRNSNGTPLQFDGVFFLTMNGPAHQECLIEKLGKIYCYYTQNSPTGSPSYSDAKMAIFSRSGLTLTLDSITTLNRIHGTSAIGAEISVLEFNEDDRWWITWKRSDATATTYYQSYKLVRVESGDSVLTTLVIGAITTSLYNSNNQLTAPLTTGSYFNYSGIFPVDNTIDLTIANNQEVQTLFQANISSSLIVSGISDSNRSIPTDSVITISIGSNTEWEFIPSPTVISTGLRIATISISQPPYKGTIISTVIDFYPTVEAEEEVVAGIDLSFEDNIEALQNQREDISVSTEATDEVKINSELR